jgi:YHS domain-containing protein
MAKDPVCGMEVDEAKAAATAVYEGITYYFCANACKTTFDKDPPEYVGKKEEGHATSCH